MSSSIATFLPIELQAGVCPSTDSTAVSTKHFTDADKIRFVKGRPQKLGGWVAQTLNVDEITGVARSIYSSVISGRVHTVIGTNSRLYSVVGSDCNNITPLETTSTPIADNLDTHYDTLASDPITTVSGSSTVTIADSDAGNYIAGDAITLSGTSAVGGFSSGDLNQQHVIRSVSTGSYTIKLGSNATTSATGGGASVVRASGLVTVNATAHGLSSGARVKLASATDFGGILAADVNREFVIRNATTNTFDVFTGGTSTSSVSGGGGASTEYYEEIPVGFVDQQIGQGYGMGQYGVGLYGTALVSSGNIQYPRIWHFSSFGDTIISTPGGGAGVYAWDGVVAAAPVLVPNAPTEVNYAFVSDNILVTFGAGGVVNKIFSSDQGDIEEWTGSSTNQVFEDNIEGAGELISHANVNGTNLIFTRTQCYTLSYIGLPNIWDIEFVDNIGLIAPMARVVVKGVAYWMGQDNFYLWRGGNVEVVPSNTSRESTLLKYVFENINRGQASKSFAWYNKRYDEIWFHYPSSTSDEVDRIARFHVSDLHWTPDTMDRLAAEYPATNLQYPRLIDSENNLFRHETGTDANGEAMPWRLVSNMRNFGTDNVMVSGIIPDSIQTGDIDFTVDSFSYPQSVSVKNTKTVTVEPSTEIISLDIDGRFLQYTLEGEELGQEWIMGDWMEPVQTSSREE